MQPDKQPTVGPDYGFIFETKQQKHRRLSFGNSRKQRIMVVIVAGMLLVIGSYIFLTIIKTQSNRGNGELIDLAAYQTELARIIEIGIKSASSVTIKNNAATASLSMKSDLVRTKKLLASKNANFTNEELAKYKATALDKQLDDAKNADTFDEAYSSLMDEKLGSYIEKLASVYSAQSSPAAQNLLRIFKTHAQLLSFNYSPATN